MKSCLLLAFMSLVVPGALQAMEVWDLGDESYLLKAPQYPGTSLYFNGEPTALSEDGVCVVLGYELAARGSGRANFTYTHYDVVAVNDEGRVVGGAKGPYLNQIVCLNKVQQVLQDKLTVLDSPRHKYSDLYFAGSSKHLSIHGTCRALKHERGVAGSALVSASDSYEQDTIQVDDDGNVIGGPRTSQYVKKIYCLDGPELEKESEGPDSPFKEDPEEEGPNGSKNP